MAGERGHKPEMWGLPRPYPEGTQEEKEFKARMQAAWGAYQELVASDPALDVRTIRDSEERQRVISSIVQQVRAKLGGEGLDAEVEAQLADDLRETHWMANNID